MNKKSTAKKSTEGIRLTLRSGIVPLMNFILFYPTTTIEDIRTTIDTAEELIDEGAGATYYPYVEAFSGSSIMQMGYDVEYDNFVVEYTTKYNRYI